MPRTLPAGLEAELAKRGSPQRLVHLLEVERGDGTRHYWASHELNVAAILSGASEQFKSWLIEPYPELTLSMSLRADAGEIKLQNLSGNTIDREVAALIKANEFERAYCIYRRYLDPFSDGASPAGSRDVWQFHGQISEVGNVTPTEASFRLVQLMQPNEVSAYDGRFSRPCRWRFNSPMCGYRRGELFVPLTTADTFSASTIGKTGLGVLADYYRWETVMILEGTGNGQERYIASHTADVFTVSANWITTPDGTSKFIVTGPGTMLVSATLADIFSATTIGKTGSGWTVDAYKDQLAVPISGTGATGDFRTRARRITGNTATTLTVSPAFAVTPDGTTRFIVVYRDCDFTRATCSLHGVLERFSGVIHLQPQLTLISTPGAVNPGGGGRGGGGGWSGGGLDGFVPVGPQPRDWRDLPAEYH